MAADAIKTSEGNHLVADVSRPYAGRQQIACFRPNYAASSSTVVVSRALANQCPALNERRLGNHALAFCRHEARWVRADAQMG